MDGMEGIASAFAGFNSLGGMHFSPFMMINKSGTCAASRILQLRQMGVYECMVEDKITKEAQAGDPDFKLKLRCVQAVKSKCNKDNEHCCVLWRWQVCEGAAKRESDYGELVFTDTTTTRFLVMETHQHWHDSAWEHTKAMAKQFFCLLRYIGYDPKYVRYAVFSADRPELPAALTNRTENPNPLEPERPGPSSFGQIDVSNCTPALTPSTVSKVDIILSRDKSVLRSAEKSREKSGLTKEGLQKEVVLQSKEGASAKDKAGDPKLMQYCASCRSTAEEKGVEKLRRCGRCFIPYYCGVECQRAHYKVHKLYCKQAAGS